MGATDGQQRAYQEWRAMVRVAYQQGITVHGPWREAFANFLKDMGDPPVGKHLHRKDFRVSFCPSNCEWS